jgi:hypothetical protein
VLISRNGEAVSLVTISASAQGIGQIMWIMRPSKTPAFTFIATLTGAKGPHHSRLISPYLSHCSAVSQIGRLSGHSKYIEPEKKLGTINLGNTSRYIDKSFDGMPSVPLT